MDEYVNQQNRRESDPIIKLIAQKVDKVECSVDKLTEAITKLAVIDERQIADRQTLERAFLAIQKSDERWLTMFEKSNTNFNKLEERVDTLEKAAPETQQTIKWVKTALWSAAAFSVFIVLTKIGLLK
jgi:prefoldin subunit 5